MKAEAKSKDDSTGENLALEACGERASEEIEAYCGRRFVYRGTFAADEGDILAPLALANGSPFGSPAAVSSEGRTLRVKVTDPAYALRAGTITITGQGYAGSYADGLSALSERILLPSSRGGCEVALSKVFAGAITIAVADLVGHGADTKMSVSSVLPCRDSWSPREPRAYVWLLDYPVQQVLEVNEDDARTFGTGTRLVLDRDFVLDRETGELTRVTGSTPYEWRTGVKVGRGDYVGGYRDSADKAMVPRGLRSACAQLGIMIYREVARELQGVSSRSDAAQTVTRYSMAGLGLFSELDARSQGTLFGSKLGPYMRTSYMNPVDRERPEF